MFKWSKNSSKLNYKGKMLAVLKFIFLKKSYIVQRNMNSTLVTFIKISYINSGIYSFTFSNKLEITHFQILSRN